MSAAEGLTAQFDAAVSYAENLGREQGKNAAGWFFDGNTDRATYAAVLAGIEAGDPAVTDRFPSPDLSGEWAERLTGPELVRDAIASSGLDWAQLAEDGEDWFTDICDAYENAFSSAVEDEISRVARYQTEEN